jgi:hypothetical protein
MIRKESPSIAGRFCFEEKFPHPIKEILPILVISENVATLNSPNDNVVQNPGSVQAGNSWHKR